MSSDTPSFVKNATSKVHSMITNKKKEKNKALEVELNGQKYELASFNRRLFGATIDMVILAFMMVPFSYALTFLGMGKKITEMQLDSQLISSTQDLSSFISNAYASGILLPYLLIQLILLTVMLSYFIVFWLMKGTTPGKMLVGCILVDSMTGKRITLGQTLLRIFGYIIAPLTLFISIFMIDFSKKRQALHDKMAGTLVVLKSVKKD